MTGSGDRTVSGEAPARTECADHTPCPADYNDWHDWANKMVETHKQTMCTDCGMYKIWVPK